MKTCPNCGKEKPLTDFYKDKSRRDKHSRICRDCTYARVRAWQHKNPEKMRQQRARYRAEHSTHEELATFRERRAEYQREYYATHRDKFREMQHVRYRRKHPRPKERKSPTPEELEDRRQKRLKWQREYYAANREELREKKRVYRKKHLHKIRAYHRHYYHTHHDHMLALKAKYRAARRARKTGSGKN
jgi:hypothetical protein